MRYRKLIEPYLIDHGKNFKLKHIDPNAGDDSGLKGRSKELLSEGIDQLSELQEKLYAQNTWGLLIIFQAMDAAGKDSTIKHVLSGVNPQGCEVYSFKQPSSEELDHDFLWRTMKRLPERGRIGIFNRSYYEETLVVRVHPELLERQQLPQKLVNASIWHERFEDICAFERYLTRNGIAIIKFFLHVSPAEHKERFLKRLDNPNKNWKFSAADVNERRHWDEYMHAYEEMIQHTATPHAPWVVVPADHKWFTRLIVAGAIIQKLNSLELAFPQLDDERKKELAESRKLLA